MLRLRDIFAAIVLALSALGPGVSYAAYCMSTYTTGARTYFVLGTQPTNPATCAYIAVSGAEWAQYQTDTATLANVSNAVTTNTNAINSLNASVAGIANTVNSLSTTVSGQASSLNTLSGNYGSTQTALAQVQQNYSTVLGYQTQSFDLNTGLAAFAFFFSTVLFFYAVAAGAGAILEKIRHPLGRGT